MSDTTTSGPSAPGQWVAQGMNPDFQHDRFNGIFGDGASGSIMVSVGMGEAKETVSRTEIKAAIRKALKAALKSLDA